MDWNLGAVLELVLSGCMSQPSNEEFFASFKFTTETASLSEKMLVIDLATMSRSAIFFSVRKKGEPYFLHISF